MENEDMSQSFWNENENTKYHNKPSIVENINHTRSNSENIKRIVPSLNLKKLLPFNVIPKLCYF